MCKLRKQRNLFLNVVDIVFISIQVQDLDGYNLSRLVMDALSILVKSSSNMRMQNYSPFVN